MEAGGSCGFAADCVPSSQLFSNGSPLIRDPLCGIHVSLSCTIDGLRIEIRRGAKSRFDSLICDDLNVDDKPYKPWHSEYVSWTAAVTSPDGSRCIIDVLERPENLSPWFYVFVDGEIRFDVSGNGSPVPELPEFGRPGEFSSLRLAGRCLLASIVAGSLIALVTLVAAAAINLYLGTSPLIASGGLELAGFGGLLMFLYAPVEFVREFLARSHLQAWTKVREAKLSEQDAA